MEVLSLQCVIKERDFRGTGRGRVLTGKENPLRHMKLQSAKEEETSEEVELIHLDAICFVFHSTRVENKRACTSLP